MQTHPYCTDPGLALSLSSCCTPAAPPVVTHSNILDVRVNVCKMWRLLPTKPAYWACHTGLPHLAIKDRWHQVSALLSSQPHLVLTPNVYATLKGNTEFKNEFRKNKWNILKGFIITVLCPGGAETSSDMFPSSCTLISLQFSHCLLLPPFLLLLYTLHNTEMYVCHFYLCHCEGLLKAKYQRAEVFICTEVGTGHLLSRPQFQKGCVS